MFQRTLRGIAGSVLGAVLALVGLGVVAAPASAAPDPDLYPNVDDLPLVTATWTTYGAANSVGTVDIPHLVGPVPAGTAKVMHGRVVNNSGIDQCFFANARGTGFLSSSSSAANLMILESEGLPAYFNTRLPALAYPALQRGYPIVTTSTEVGDGWVCDFGTLLAQGESFEYSVTVGVPLGGTAINSVNLRVRVGLEAAGRPPASWSDSDFFSSSLVNTATTPFTVNASTPHTGWNLANGIEPSVASPGRAFGAYGVVTNDLDVPVTVSFSRLEATGTLVRFIVYGVDGFPDPVTLAPGESTETFLMKLGSPVDVGNESRLTSMAFSYVFDVRTPAVTFNPNGGMGSMDPQTATAPTALTPNAFTRPGYRFVGWNTAADGSGAAYADEAEFGFDANTTLYAQWEETGLPGSEHTVTFDAHGGAGSMGPQTATAPTALAHNAFTRPGYRFVGWNTAADGSGTWYKDDDEFPFDADVTLFAQWEPLGAPGPDPGSGGSGPTSGGALADTGAGNLLPLIMAGTLAVAGGSGLLLAAGQRSRRRHSLPRSASSPTTSCRGRR